jgi:hypothetical protein
MPKIVRKHGQLTQDGRFRWSAGWGQWVPTGKETMEPSPSPLESGPLPPERHSASCMCNACLTTAQRVADYLKNRDLWGNGGLK